MEQKKQDRQFYRVWMGEKERIASFHEVAGYRRSGLKTTMNSSCFSGGFRNRGFAFSEMADAQISAYRTALITFSNWCFLLTDSIMILYTEKEGGGTFA